MASSPTYAAFSTPTHRRCSFFPPAPQANPSLLKLRSIQSPRIKLRCNSNGDSGECFCKSVLDAFFLGKAIGDFVGERIQSSVGELLGAIGSLQTEQLKHISQIQEEVLEKAKRAKEETTEGTQALVSEAASTVKEATQEAQALVSEAASTAKQATEGIVTEAASTLEEAAEGAHGIVSEAVSLTEQVTGETEELISGAASKATDVSKTISSLLNPLDDSFKGLFNKD